MFRTSYIKKDFEMIIYVANFYGQWIMPESRLEAFSNIKNALIFPFIPTFNR